MNATLKVETKCLADQLAAGTSIRRIVLANGSTWDHEVGPLDWVSRILLTQTHNNQTQTTEPTQ